jgi:hypothetical protein
MAATASYAVPMGSRTTDVSSQDFRFGIAEKSLCPSIEVLNPAFGVDHDDAVDRRIDDGFEPLGAGRCDRGG